MGRDPVEHAKRAKYKPPAMRVSACRKSHRKVAFCDIIKMGDEKC